MSQPEGSQPERRVLAAVAAGSYGPETREAEVARLVGENAIELLNTLAELEGRGLVVSRMAPGHVDGYGKSHPGSGMLYQLTAEGRYSLWSGT